MSSQSNFFSQKIEQIDIMWYATKWLLKYIWNSFYLNCCCLTFLCVIFLFVHRTRFRKFAYAVIFVIYLNGEESCSDSWRDIGNVDNRFIGLIKLGNNWNYIKLTSAFQEWAIPKWLSNVISVQSWLIACIVVQILTA